MLVDFIAYREALQKKGIDTKDIQPDVPIDLVIDHSYKLIILVMKMFQKIILKKNMKETLRDFLF